MPAPYELKDSGERQEFDTGAKRDVQDGKPRFALLSPFALERVAWIYTEGAKKYGDNNWQKGIPFSRYLDSAERHLQRFKQGFRDEDHLAQAVWNLMAILHHQEVGPDGLDDLPRYQYLQKDVERGIESFEDDKSEEGVEGPECIGGRVNCPADTDGDGDCGSCTTKGITVTTKPFTVSSHNIVPRYRHR